MMHGRTNVDVFVFTQEFLSRMLGVSRARVNIVTGALEKAGLIKAQSQPDHRTRLEGT